MKANELRIGNLITDEWYDTFKKIITVESINEKGIELGIENSNDYPELQSHWIEPYYTFDELRGIPLTEEWLLKFWFEKEVIEIGGPGINELADEWCLDGYCFMFDVSGDLFITGYNWNTKHIQYVHQLQNLYFALTGEELTLTPL